MKKIILFQAFAMVTFISFAQPDAIKGDATLPPGTFTIEKSIQATSVKNQALTGTCWCFSTTSLIESQCIKKGIGQLDISEMFAVRNIYIEKAKNYILRQGYTKFGEGALGHDLIRAIATYGAVPERDYSGLTGNEKMHNHSMLVSNLKQYLDSIMKLRPVPLNWMDAYINILDAALGKPPAEFVYQGKRYTPKTFATDFLKFDASEYVNITSFTHHPFYAPFILEVQDNFSNGAYYNLPLEEMILVTKDALRAGYSVLWDTDISNDGFMQKMGVASHYDTTVNSLRKMNLRTIRAEALQRAKDTESTDVISSRKNNTTGIEGFTNSTNTNPQQPVLFKEESKWNAEIRQALFENLSTQDDHLMHITGIGKTVKGKTYFLVKDSYGDVGPAHGYINVSEAYFAINTVSLIIPKAALSKELLIKLGVK